MKSIKTSEFDAFARCHGYGLLRSLPWYAYLRLLKGHSLHLEHFVHVPPDALVLAEFEPALEATDAYIEARVDY